MTKKLTKVPSYFIDFQIRFGVRISTRRAPHCSTFVSNLIRTGQLVRGMRLYFKGSKA